MNVIVQLPQTLIDALKQGEVIPFVGAGLSLAVNGHDNKPLFPSWYQLLVGAADKLDAEQKPAPATAIRSALEYVEDNSYLRAAQIAEKELTPAIWYDYLKQTFDKKHHQCQLDSLNAAEQVWHLGSELVITTNYDKVLDWAHSVSDKTLIKHWDIQSPHSQSKAIAQSVTEPTIWHLHGCIDNVENLVLCPQGYETLYGQNDSENAAQTTLKAMLASRTMVFIGFSFADQRFAYQLEAIKQAFAGCSKSHYVLVQQDGAKAIEALNLPLIVISYERHDDLPAILASMAEYVSKIDEQAQSLAVSTQSDKAANYDLNNPPFNLPYAAKGEGMIGRADSLKELRAQLLSAKRTSIGHAAAFRGMGGLGKTQLAVEYAYQFRDEYPGGIIWLIADQDISAQLIELCITSRWMAPSSERSTLLNTALHRLDEFNQGLVIFDNVDTMAQITDYLPKKSGNAHILATSRAKLESFNQIALPQLTLSQSLTLLCNEAAIDEGLLDEEQREAAERIATQLDHLPLALEIAGAYIKHLELAFSDYLSILTDSFKTALDGNYLDSFTQHERDLYATLKVTDKELADQPLLSEVIAVFSYSAAASMGVSLLATLLEVKEASLIAPLALGRKLKLLTGEDNNERHSLHRLVSKVQRDTNPITQKLDWATQIAERLQQWFKIEDFADLTAFESEQNHLLAWHSIAKAHYLPQTSALIWLQAYPCWHWGEYQQAQEYLTEALAIQNNLAYSSKDITLANIINDLGSVASALGEYQQALEYKKKALALRLELFEDRHPDIARSYNNIGSTYGDLGQYEKALELHQKALALRLELFGDIHPDIATSYNNIGGTFRYLGQYEKALEYLQKALVLRLELFGDTHPNIASSYNNIGSTYGDLGQYEKALELQQKALVLRLELFGDTHPDIASSYNNIGSIYGDLGQYEKALELQQKALALLLELFGDTHPNIAGSYHNIGSTYGDLGQYEKALELQQKALAIWLELFGGEHPDSVNSFRGVVLSLVKMRQFKLAKQKIYEFSKQLAPNSQFIAEINNVKDYLNYHTTKAGFSLRNTAKKPRKKRTKRK